MAVAGLWRQVPARDVDTVIPSGRVAVHVFASLAEFLRDPVVPTPAALPRVLRGDPLVVEQVQEPHVVMPPRHSDDRQPEVAALNAHMVLDDLALVWSVARRSRRRAAFRMSGPSTTIRRRVGAAARSVVSGMERPRMAHGIDVRPMICSPSRNPSLATRKPSRVNAEPQVSAYAHLCGIKDSETGPFRSPALANRGRLAERDIRSALRPSSHRLDQHVGRGVHAGHPA